MVFPYLIVFCRIAIGLVFVISLVGKARALQEFTRTITRFQIFPPRYSGALALVALAAELLIVALMLAGGGWLWAGFLITIVVLGAFSLALRWVIARKIDTSCNCFGTHQQPVSSADLWRNGGLIICALGGIGALAAGISPAPSLTWLEWGLIGATAVAFVGLWLHVSDIHWVVQSEVTRKKEVARGSTAGD